jgi:SAM-dependent methyltransferase
METGMTEAPGRLPDDGAELFTRSVLDYAAERAGKPVALLVAGCTTNGGALDVPRLLDKFPDMTISMVDEDSPLSRAAVAEHPDLSPCTLADLRIVPLAPRSFDVVACCRLLERIRHAELVLDRLVEALKPGGLLLLRTGDAGCITGFLDRVLPGAARGLVWRWFRPGEPGPFPAVYEELISERGIRAYLTRRGLVMGRRQALDVLASPTAPGGARTLRGLAAALARSRLTAAHDELRYVIRKPEDRFARVL